jgi:hypothetical protein
VRLGIGVRLLVERGRGEEDMFCEEMEEKKKNGGMDSLGIDWGVDERGW